MRTATEARASNRYDYVQAQAFLLKLYKHRSKLTSQQIKTLKEQAIHGDINGAELGLEVILKRKE